MTAIQILIYPGFDELDAVAPLEILRSAGLDVRLVTVDGGAPEVPGGHGLRVGIDGALGDDADLLIVPGGGWSSGANGGTRIALAEGILPAEIARLHAGGTTVASICTGGVLLAASGLLTGRPATTHRAATDYLREQGADVREDARVIDDGDVLTAGGVTSGIDLSLHLVERYVGAEAAERGAIRIEHDRRGPLLVTERAAAANSGSPR